MADLTIVWKLAEAWDREHPRSLEMEGCRVQFYMGAMEIPLVAFRPRPYVQPRNDRMQELVPALVSLGLVLDTVEVNQNYKINRRDTNEYVGRILSDALKLHCERIFDLGREAFESIVTFYLSLPRC